MTVPPSIAFVPILLFPLGSSLWGQTAPPQQRGERYETAADADDPLIDHFSADFSEFDDNGLTSRLPPDLRQLVFLLWVDEYVQRLAGNDDSLVALGDIAEQLHRDRPQDLFALYVLILVERAQGRPARSLELLAPIAVDSCRSTSRPTFDTVALGGGSAGRSPYMMAFWALHLDLLDDPTVERTYLRRLVEPYRLLIAYSLATGCETPIERLRMYQEVSDLALADDETLRLSTAVQRRLRQRHPVWSAVLPDDWFATFALLRVEKIWHEAGRAVRSVSGAEADEAALDRLRSAHRARRGNLAACLWLAAYEDGRGRGAAALHVLSDFWSARALEPPRAVADGPDRPLPLGSLLVLGGRHASAAFHDGGLPAYVRQLAFYIRRSFETIPAVRGGLLVALAAITLLRLMQLVVRASTRMSWLRVRLEAMAFSWWNSRRDSRLVVEMGSSLPEPEERWGEHQNEQTSCELALLVAALATTELSLRQELGMLLRGSPATSVPPAWAAAIEATGEALGDASLDATQLLRALVRLSPGSPTYWIGLLRDLSFAQFEELERPLVELVANAVDATLDDHAGNAEVAPVEVTFERRDDLIEVRVWDGGCGMAPESVLFDLMVPLTTTKRDSLATIGRFGVGFYSVLRYLTHPDAVVEVETCDGAYRTRLKLTPPQRVGAETPLVNMEVTPYTQRRGTSVRLRADIDRDAARALLERSFRFLERPRVLLSNRPVNASNRLRQDRCR